MKSPNFGCINYIIYQKKTFVKDLDSPHSHKLKMCVCVCFFYRTFIKKTRYKTILQTLTVLIILGRICLWLK